MAEPEQITSEVPEVRDNAELAEEAMRTTPIVAAPMGVNGRPMSRIWCAVSDKVPTVQFGNVVLTVGAERWIDDFGDGIEGRQHRIDRERELMKDSEFAVGVERRLLQWAIDPASKVASPVSGEDAFAAPPPGYDASQVVDPRDLPAAAAVPAPDSQPPSMAQDLGQPTVAEAAEAAGQPPQPPPATIG